MRGDVFKGMLALLAGFTIWGISPILYKALDHAGSLEVLAHRVIWSMALFGLLLGVQGRMGMMARVLTTRGERLPIIASALLVAVNWGLFILAVQSGNTTEASLGYFIFPLVSVLLGIIVLGERIGLHQGIAVMIAGVGVCVLTIGAGALPVFSFGLATTFGLYSLLKKQARTGPFLSVSAECLLILPLALIWAVALVVSGRATFGSDFTDSALMIASGPITALPLVLFSYGARRVSMAISGLMSYINPSLQFLVAVFLFFEPFTAWHGAAFGCIWLAVLLYVAPFASRREREGQLRVPK